MKKKISLIVLTLLLDVVFSYAQSKKFQFGVNAQLGISTFRGDFIARDNISPRLSYGLGVSVAMKLQNNTSLQTGLVYEIKGSKTQKYFFDPDGTINPISQGIAIKGSENYQYLSIPILLRHDFGEEKKQRIYLEGGGYTSYLVGYSVSVEQNPIRPSGTFDISTKSLPKLDFGLSAGTGITFPLKTEKSISLGLRSNLGSTNIDATDTKNLSFQLISCYFF